jgi:hypothetical protein
MLFSLKRLNGQTPCALGLVVSAGRGPAGGIIEHGDMLAQSAELFGTLQALVESWCDRRCLKALRAVLRGYPLSSPFTDGWGELLLALQDVRAFARNELTDGERATVDDCIRTVERLLHRE